MTVEELRKFPGCENYTDEEAVDIIQTLEKLAVFLFEFTGRENVIIIDNQLIISEEEKIKTSKLAA